MAGIKTKFRTNQEEYFEPDDQFMDQPAMSGSNGKFIAVVAAGIICAALLGTLLSFTA